MELFECKLVNRGYVQELFFRDGENAESILDGLKMFQWPKGTWTITKVH